MAQSATTATLCCLKTETELDIIAGGLYRNLQQNGRTFGTAAAIEDNSGNTLNQVFNPRKARPDGTGPVVADVKYMIPRCDETTDGEVTFDCTDAANAESTYGYETVTLDQQVSEEFSIAADSYDERCEDPMGELAKELIYRTQSMRSKYNRKLTTLLAASVGGKYIADQAGDPLADVTTAVTPAKLKLFHTVNGQSVPQPMGIYDLTYQYQRMAPDMPRTPVLINGSKALGAYAEGRRIFGGNVDGLDPNDGSPLSNVYTDWQMPDVLSGSPAANPLISFLPGSLELLEFFEFDNPEQVLSQSGRVTWAPVQSSGTLVRQKVDIGTAVLGRPFIVDLQIRYDECTNRVHYKMRKDFGLFNIPAGAFCSGANWNYKLLWDIVCEAYDCTDALG